MEHTEGPAITPAAKENASPRGHGCFIHISQMINVLKNGVAGNVTRTHSNAGCALYAPKTSFQPNVLRKHLPSRPPDEGCYCNYRYCAGLLN